MHRLAVWLFHKVRHCTALVRVHTLALILTARRISQISVIWDSKSKFLHNTYSHGRHQHFSGLKLAALKLIVHVANYW